MRHGAPRRRRCSWRVRRRRPARERLSVRPFLSGRDYHALHHENGAFRFEPERQRRAVSSGGRTTASRRFTSLPTASYRHEPDWYRNFLYDEGARARARRHRGPRRAGRLQLGPRRRARRPADLRTRAPTQRRTSAGHARRASSTRRDVEAARGVCRRRCIAPPTPISCSAAPARRSSPAIPGSPTGDATRSSRCAACASPPAARRGARHPARVGAARLGRACCRTASPTRRGARVQRGRRLALVRGRGARAPRRAERCGSDVAEPIARRSRARSTRSSTATRAAPASASALDDDGLLAAGEPGVQLTWMDAKVGDRVVTPRIGKPVEVQALWLNALSARERTLAAVARAVRRAAAPRSRRASGTRRRGCLYDVVDVDHVPGTVDRAFRPNQIFAVGGLPVRAGRATTRARRVVDAVEARLLDAARPALARARRARLLGALRRRRRASATAPTTRARSGRGCSAPFVEAWVRVRGGSAEASARGARALPRAAARASRRGRPRPRLRDRRRRAPHARRLPVPGLVGRRGAAARSRLVLATPLGT